LLTRPWSVVSFDKKLLAAETTEERLLWSISSKVIFALGYMSLISAIASEALVGDRAHMYMCAPCSASRETVPYPLHTRKP